MSYYLEEILANLRLELDEIVQEHTPEKPNRKINIKLMYGDHEISKIQIKDI